MCWPDQIDRYRENEDLQEQLDAAARENEALKKERDASEAALRPRRTKRQADETRKKLDTVLREEEANDDTTGCG